MAFSEDLSVFFDTNDFAESAAYTPRDFTHPSTQTTTINGIFQDRFIEINGVATKKSTFLCATSSVPNVDNGDWLTVKSIDFTVGDSEPDGTGLTLLILVKQ